uniref:Putative receptor-like protein kinase At5g20050 n=1 Tax=Anthurium amnicola TaxID=1678845 RepID=A0A1D1Y809_9ARAE
MEAGKARALYAAAVASLLVLLVILWLCFGISKPFFVFAAVDSAAIVAIAAWATVHRTTLDRRLSMARRAAVEGEELRLQYSHLRKAAGLPTLFRYEQLAAATDGFSAVLGRGASASVFKGILDDGTPVAVKRIDGDEGHGDREFRAEVAALAALQHVNLLRLLGYCLLPRPGTARYLVYDYVPNGSLDNWIFPTTTSAGGDDIDTRKGGCLPWDLRYRVAVDVAKALAYLHHDCRSRILHLDVKPENILLDEAFRACVADFGLSKLMGKEESRVVTTVRGTRGYLAPEWLLDSGISEKSDVFSYGMVLLEMVGGRRNVTLVGADGPASGRRWSYFPRTVADRVRQGRVMEVVDPRLAAVPEGEVRTAALVALWCVQETAGVRPSMAQVVDMLEGRVAVEPPPETEMLVVDILGIEPSSPAGGRDAAGSPLGRKLDGQCPATSTCSLSLSVLSGR